MTDVKINEACVLSLNRNWQILSFVTVERALNRLTGGVWGRSVPALAVPMDMAEDGSFFIAGSPMKWSDWIELPIRDYDRVLRTAKGLIRCPCTIIRPSYSKLHLKKPKLTSAAILERDGNVCQYTNRKLPRSQLNIDHIHPQSKGGQSTWTNMVACDKDLNFRKGNKSNDEAGIRLIRTPLEPKAMPVSFFIREARLPEHVPFIIQ